MVFGIVMIIFMIIAIIRGIFYIIYQKSDKMFISPMTYCRLDAFSLSLIHKRKKIDSFIMYQKHKGYYYILGTKNIYKMGWFKLIVLDENNTNSFEKKIIAEMKKDCREKIVEYNTLLQNLALKYVDDTDDSSIS